MKKENLLLSVGCVVLFLLSLACSKEGGHAIGFESNLDGYIELQNDKIVKVEMVELGYSSATTYGLPRPFEKESLLSIKKLLGDEDLELTTPWDYEGNVLLGVKVTRGRYSFNYGGMERLLLDPNFTYLIKVTETSISSMKIGNRRGTKTSVTDSIRE